MGGVELQAFSDVGLLSMNVRIGLISSVALWHAQA